MTVLRSDGTTIHQREVQAGDLVTLDVRRWPTGAYHVLWTGTNGETESRTFVVVQP